MTFSLCNDFQTSYAINYGNLAKSMGINIDSRSHTKVWLIHLFIHFDA